MSVVVVITKESETEPFICWGSRFGDSAGRTASDSGRKPHAQ